MQYLTYAGSLGGGEGGRTKGTIVVPAGDCRARRRDNIITIASPRTVGSRT
jgi:hypothetical protein